MNKNKIVLIIWLVITVLLLLTHIIFISNRLYGDLSGLFAYILLYVSIFMTLNIIIISLIFKFNQDNKTFKLFDNIYFITKTIMIFTYVLIHFFSFARVDGDSMNPSYYHNDLIFSIQFNYEPKREDVVIVEVNPYAKYLKRIAGVPGDKLEFIEITPKTYFVRINDIDYLNYEIKSTDIFYIYSMLENENIIPDNYYFVLGDNAYNSQDSRNLGLFERDEILAKVIFRIWPIRK